MHDQFATLTGLDVSNSCDLAVRLYAVAAQVHALYLQADWVVRQAFPQTATGEQLELHGALRGVERKGAVPAQGTLRFTADTPLDQPRTIPQGTVCLTSGLVRFATTQEAALEAGATYVDVPAQALEAGTAGNVAADTIQIMSVAPVGVRSCTNPKPFSGGSDAESDDDLRARILSTYLRLPNGANAAFYQQCALAFDDVAAASVIPRSRGVGTVDVVVATHAGLPDESLLERLRSDLQQRREIAVDVQVRAPEEVEVDVTIQLLPKSSSSFSEAQSAVESALRAWFTGERLGEPVLLAQMGNLIYSCSQVANYAIALPTGDVDIAPGQLPVLGTLKVEAM